MQKSPWLSYIGLVNNLIILAMASFFMLKGSGFFPQPSALDIASFMAFIVLMNRTKWTFYLILLPIVILYALYTPIGLSFGPPSYQYFASVFATDLQESKEFLAQLEWKKILMALIILLSIHAFRLRQNYESQKNKNQSGGYFSASFLRHWSSLLIAFLILCFNQAPFYFLTESGQAIWKVKTELERLNKYEIESQWGTSSLENSRYDDYVLVIGESARKDYHHAYGYPIENTPFMSKANGVLINGFTSGGTNTIASLRLMLTKPDPQNWESQYRLNLVDLVKSAGIKTYWLSNQGYLGEFDTPISAIAKKSDERFFLKSGDSLNTNVSDFELLPKFEKIINQPAQGKRFIVVHIYGSHPLSCDRLTDYPTIFKQDEIDKKYWNVNCYVSTIKKTDELLQRLYQALTKEQQAQQRSFSMIYFSDHGLAHQISPDNIDIHNSNGKSKRHFDIPLFKISSDDLDRKEYQVFKSGLNFTDGIAHWIGIRNPQLNPQADLFSNQNDPDDYGLKQKIEQIKVADDPAIAIPLKSPQN